MEISGLPNVLATGEASTARMPIVVPGTTPGTNDLARYLNFWGTVVTPLADAATAAAGTSLLFARADHVHPFAIQPIAFGGTGLSAVPANGQIPIGNGTGYTLGTLTAGANVTITNAAGVITIAATGGGGGGTPGGTSGQIQINSSGAFGGVTISGDMTISAAGVAALKNMTGVTAGAYGPITVDAMGRVTQIANVAPQASPTFSGAVGYAADTTLPYAATLSPDLNALGTRMTCVMTGNATMAAPTNRKPGVFRIIFKQDATGGRTLTIPTGGIFRTGGSLSLITLSTAANAVDMLAFDDDGTSISVWMVDKDMRNT